MHVKGTPSWVFHATVIRRAVDILEEALKQTHEPDMGSFHTAEAQIAIAETRESLEALTQLCQHLENSAHQDAVERKTA